MTCRLPTKSINRSGEGISYRNMMDCASFGVICCKCIPFSIAMACASWQQKKKPSIIKTFRHLKKMDFVQPRFEKSMASSQIMEIVSKY